MGQNQGTKPHIRDGQAVLPGLPTIIVALRRSAAVRRLNLRISGLDGRVTLSMPSFLPLTQALGFLQEKEGWLRAAMGRMPERQEVGIGRPILLRGQMRQIIENPSLRRVVEQHDTVLVPPDPTGARTGMRLAAYLKAAAQAELTAASAHYAGALGLPFSAIALRDTRSRWGSCTAQGRLMYSWRLIMAPPEVLRYVAAHEVAHLRHMDHSAAFWGCVRRLMPDYAGHRDWLRQNGAALHSYCFNARPDADSA